jgi:single-strand DNA-binding protein
VATSDSYTAKDGARVEQVCFTNIVTWNRQAEVCGQYLAKGSSVVIEGRLHFEQWESQEGQKRSRHKVWANRIQFVGKRDKEGEAEPAASSSGEKAETVEVASTEEPF